MEPIEVFADVWCPFAHVALRAVQQHRDHLGHADVPLVVRAWPLELINGEPEDVAVTAAHVEDLKQDAARGLFAGFAPARFPHTTLPALALAAAAYRHTATVGERVSLALRDALWEDGLDVAERSVLDRIGAAHGVDGWGPEDERSIEEDWELGQARHVEGSPHFFCGEAAAFCPSLHVAQIGDGPHVRVTPDPEGLDAFLRRALG